MHRHYGNAQHNAAYTLIHALSNPENGALGHGPIVSVDDDAEVQPELFDIVWKVKRIGCWAMVCLASLSDIQQVADIVHQGGLGPTGWEGPVVENGKIVDWPAWQEWRKFPLDKCARSLRSAVCPCEATTQRCFCSQLVAAGYDAAWSEILADGYATPLYL